MLSNSHVNKLSMIVTAGRNQTSCRFHTCGACSRLLRRGWEAKNLTPPPQTPRWCSAPSAKVLQNNGSTEWIGTPSELWVWCKTSSFHEKLSPTWLIDASLGALKCRKRNSGNFNPSTNVKESKEIVSLASQYHLQHPCVVLLCAKTLGKYQSLCKTANIQIKSSTC